MTSPMAEWIVMFWGAYATLGLVFAAAFVAKGANAIDPAAGPSGIGFRIMIFPASAALWPLLLKRWLL